MKEAVIFERDEKDKASSSGGVGDVADGGLGMDGGAGVCARGSDGNIFGADGIGTVCSTDGRRIR